MNLLSLVFDQKTLDAYTFYTRKEVRNFSTTFQEDINYISAVSQGKLIPYFTGILYKNKGIAVRCTGDTLSNYANDDLGKDLAVVKGVTYLGDDVLILQDKGPKITQDKKTDPDEVASRLQRDITTKTYDLAGIVNIALHPVYTPGESIPQPKALEGGDILTEWLGDTLKYADICFQKEHEEQLRNWFPVPGVEIYYPDIQLPEDSEQEDEIYEMEYDLFIHSIKNNLQEVIEKHFF